MQNKQIAKIRMIFDNKNIKYDKENDIIYIDNSEANEYYKRVMLAIVKERIGVDISLDELKEILSLENIDYKNIDNEELELNEFFDIIDNDDTIKEDEWKKFKRWRNEDALWNEDKDGEKTKINECFDNIVGFLENFPKTKDKIKFNKSRNVVEIDGRQVEDNDYHTFINYINKYFIRTFSKIRMIKDAVDNVANKNKYNPWVNYFNNLKYEDDGIDYIDYTIKNVLCCEEQEKYYDLYYETLKIMFIGVMTRIYNKDKNIATKYDSVVTFCGRNGGSGKTTFFEKLFDIENNGYSYCYVVAGDSFKPGDKDFIERTHQCVCLLIDELTMKRSVVTSIKGYITQRDDRFRKSFGYTNEAHMRGFIITATSNNTDILKDYTTDNERRWLIIKMSENSKNYVNVNNAFDNGYRDKLWAYVKNIYQNDNVKLYMTDNNLLKLEADIQRDYKASNNEDYNTIVNDLLEREYGFYDSEYVDADAIVSQYKFRDSLQWCKNHNCEIWDKERRSQQDKYIIKPEDRLISYWGKIDRIQKTVLYDILNKLNIEYTKPSLAAEMRVSGRWNGHDNKPCIICGRTTKAYWRKQKVNRIDFDDIYPNRNDNYKLTEDDKSFAEIIDKSNPELLPF